LLVWTELNTLQQGSPFTLSTARCTKLLTVITVVVPQFVCKHRTTLSHAPGVDCRGPDRTLSAGACNGRALVYVSGTRSLCTIAALTRYVTRQLPATPANHCISAYR